MSGHGGARMPPAVQRLIDGTDLVRWELSYGDAVAEVLPTRGGLVARFLVDDREILYLDRQSLRPGQKVRGGIPVLFPVAGRLTADRFEAFGQSYPMRQHGLARHADWDVVEVAQAHLTMEFRSSPATLSTFPFPFVLRMTVDVGRAGGRTLAIEHQITNLGDRPLPLHLGLHPYFAVPDAVKPAVRIDTTATHGYDNVHGEPVTVDPGKIDFSARDLDLHLLDHGKSETRLRIPGRPTLHLQWSDLYQVLVLWTQPYMDFVCVEPWSAPGDALNTGQGLRHVPPGKTQAAWFTITVP